MNTYGGVEVQPDTFLISALHGDECSASRSGRFTPGEGAHGTDWIEGWVGCGAGPEAVAKRKNFPVPVPARNRSRTVLGSTQPPIQWVPGALSLGVK
jgi:hypothetical protein